MSKALKVSDRAKALRVSDRAKALGVSDRAKALGVSDRAKALGVLSQTLNYRFRDEGLLRQALTHRSASGQSNERLEFLGDAVLNFVIGEELFHAFPKVSEGQLSRLRASLVKGETLAEIARELALGEALQLGPGELKSGGFRRASILADALEAVLGAVYLDSGFDACCSVISALFHERLAALPENGDLKDPKTRLQEYLQAQQRPLPDYTVLEVSGADHAQRFTVECAVDEIKQSATASSRRKAEQTAARKVLKQLSL